MLINEDTLEQATLQWFSDLGYEYVCGYDIQPDGPSPERESYHQVLLNERVQKSMREFNSHLPAQALEQAFDLLIERTAQGLVNRNEQVYYWLRDGIPVEYSKDDEVIGDKVRLIDFESIDANDFLVVNQFKVKDLAKPRKPDIVLFVNGIPLVVIELKNPADADTDVWKAFDQIETYKDQIPSLFETTLANIISDGLEALIGSLTASKERYMPWRVVRDENDIPKGQWALETLIKGFCDKHRLLEFFRNYVLYLGKENRFKVIAAYHQFHGVRAAVRNALLAVNHKNDGKVGVFWHTQGSGKSFSALFFSAITMTHPEMCNPTILVVTDRNDLDGQLYQDFAAAEKILREKPVQIDSRDEVKAKLMNRPSGGVFFTTIQKFAPSADENTYPVLSDRKNIIVITDESHRSQYGLRATLDPKTGKIKYGYAKYLRDAFPNASFLGFTGTPIDQVDKDTRAVFGDYVSIYDIEDAVKDGATVPLYYESRIIELDADEDVLKSIDEEVESIIDDDDVNVSNRAKSKWAALEALASAAPRIEKLAADFVEHFESRCEKLDGKAMIVGISRNACVDLYDAITKLRPEWHSDDLNSGAIKVIMTSSAQDGAKLAKHSTSKTEKDTLAKRFKDPEDPLRIVIVRDMWLTGFDSPSVHTLYIDKPMKGANLMQAIARANRVFKDKPGGLVVDYIGIANELKEALMNYTKSDGKGKPVVDTAEAAQKLLETVELAREMLHGCDYSGFEDPKIAMKVLPLAMDHICGVDPGEVGAEVRTTDNPGVKQYLDIVAAMSKAQALAGEHEDVLHLKPEIAFFQAVGSMLKKFTNTKKKVSDENRDHALKQLLSQSVYAGDVIDIYSKIGIENPDISILDERFLDEVAHLEQKNLAVELLEKLLADKIKARGKLFVAQEKKYSELLEQSIIKYRNRSIETAQVIEEMIELAKKFNDAIAKGDELGLNDDEYAFYDALEKNEAAVRELGDKTLKKIACELTALLKKESRVDFSKKDNIQAKMRKSIKRLLRKYKYPPDGQLEAVERVMQQAVAIEDNWVE
ncbi:type I restriction endonuclease subunit R [Thiomicrorhabdus xiamenensis]|uniref:Type I restriction enzyme endonuclease subunit n=1 Tax=Thiomicrorhabdus xiamenensis TaxID=2739063 RepID=A0A7D4NRK5_9GAMM|nr:type I restriction endonuclease subunit R [Thiomicrorhabdus xiamenensis]QKI89630.1 type I restriction endonuclease subunit R [Thiomicrorhabdus xiamenensis]